jgi:hypothetical protein
VVKDGVSLIMKSPDLFSIRVLMQPLKQIHSRYSNQNLTASDFTKRRRPSIIIWLLLSFAVSFPLVVQAADARATPPAAELLQAGDLIWPKKPGAFVPYNSRPGEADASDASRWLVEKKAYLKRLQRNPNLCPEEKERYSALENMTYKEFAARYLGDRIPGKPDTFGLAGIEVGHVGIIEIRDGRPFVVEAMWGPGVQRLSYADWVEKRPGELFWVGHGSKKFHPNNVLQ